MGIRSEVGTTARVTPKRKGLKTVSRLGKVDLPGREPLQEVDVLTQNLSGPLAQSLVEIPGPSYACPEHSPNLVCWQRSDL